MRPHSQRPPGVPGQALHGEPAERIAPGSYQQLFHALDEGCCLIEVLFDEAGRPIDYRFLDTNPAFERQTGLQHAAGRRALELVPALERHWIEIYGAVALSGQARRFQQHSPAMGRWFNVFASPLPELGASVVALLFSDMTRQRSAETELRRLAAELAASDQRKTQFLAVLAHELRNPLAPLRSGLEVMRRGAGEPQALQRVQAMMERQLHHLVTLVDDLLDVARISAGSLALRRERVALDTLVQAAEEASRPLMDAAGHDFALQLPEPPLWLDADPTRMVQLLSNLLNNAASFTPRGGRIRLLAWREGEHLVLEVSDSGQGLDADALRALQTALAQLPPAGLDGQDGLGVGLALVRQLVHLHGGTLQVHSDGPGRGARFAIWLPLASTQDGPGGTPGSARQAAAAPGPAHGAAAADGGGAHSAAASRPGPLPVPALLAPRRVLVVDDNADAGESLVLLLQLGGHQVRLASNGDEALAVARAFRPELAFLDIGMPGMDGCELARRLRKEPEMRQLMLVALTGWGSDDDRERTRRAGFDHHLTKPADPLAIDAVLLAARPRH